MFEAYSVHTQQSASRMYSQFDSGTLGVLI